MPWHIDSAPGSHALRSTTHLSASHLSAMQSSASAGKGSARQEPAERPSVTFAGGPCAPLQLRLSCANSKAEDAFRHGVNLPTRPISHCISPRAPFFASPALRLLLYTRSISTKFQQTQYSVSSRPSGFQLQESTQAGKNLRAPTSPKSCRGSLPTPSGMFSESWFHARRADRSCKTHPPEA